jgi:hypothetical protein
MSMNSRTKRLTNLATGLAAAFALIGMGSQAFAAVLPVTSCADDNSSGTLRSVAASALSGDTISLSGLVCLSGTITLTQGEVVFAHNATVAGSALNLLTIVNGGDSRVLHSTSNDTPSAWLDIANVNISGGRVSTQYDSADGGCILASGALTLTNSIVSECAASSSDGWARGGAIYAHSVDMASSAVLTSSAVSSGEYQVARGGGIYANSLTCSNSTLSGNGVAAGTDWFDQGGGALIVGGDVTLDGCTLSANSAGEGGALLQFEFSGSQGQTIVRNSTISGNFATLAVAGLEVACPECTPNPVQLTNSTIVLNSSAPGSAAGVQTSGDVVAQSSIVALNQNAPAGTRSSGADIGATSISGANNLVMLTNASRGAGVITFSVDPQLSALANTGGMTQVHALLATSPALNHGNNSAGLTSDQRGTGFVRSISGTTDIGAYQHQPTTTRR